MRNAALTLCVVALSYAAAAQKFSLLPQVGFENSKTKISFNDLASFAPLGVKFSPQASLRLNYSSKQGHGFFLGVATSRSVVSFSFTDPETGMNNFIATTGNMQLRMEGGYQFNTKPISLNGAKQPAGKKQLSNNGKRNSSCCSRNYSSNHCSGNKTRQSFSGKTKNSWVRMQPSVGLGFIPAVRSDVVTKSQGGQTTYQYNAGNWKTALIAGTGFEFGRGSTRQFTVSINYFKGIGNLDEQTISSETTGKSVTTILESATSGWNIKVGIPFTLTGKKPAMKHRSEKLKTPCSQYRIIHQCVRSL